LTHQFYLVAADRPSSNDLSSQDRFFADSLHVIRALIKAGNVSLQIDGKACKPNLSAVFETLFQERFKAHDALEDVTALHKILFDSPLNLKIAQIVNNSNLMPCSHAFADMQFLDERFERMQAFRNKLYHLHSDNGAVRQRVIKKIAESGLSYHDLENLFRRAGKEGLVAVLSKAPTTSKSTKSPRGTNKAARDKDSRIHDDIEQSKTSEQCNGANLDRS